MNRFQQIEALFFEVLAEPEAGREDLLRRRCGDDHELYNEIITLLQHADAADSVIELAPKAIAASLLETETKHELINHILGNYKIESLLGVGGMGEVYKAQDLTLGRFVALKVLPARFSSHPERRQRFEREARAASSLNHPNIITVHGFGHENDLDFIATEFIEGETLRQRLDDGPLAAADVVAITLQVFSAIEAAHAVGVVHRDLKPANIMIRPDGVVKVLDFGLAKITETFSDSDAIVPISRLGVMGTVHYMSPEQALGQSLDHRTDIFSLGVTIFEMLTGRLPFHGTTEAAVYDAILNKPAIPLADTTPQSSNGWQTVIDRALAKDPAERYQNVAEFREALVCVSEGKSLPMNNGRSRGFLKPAAAVLAVVVLLTVGGWYFWKSARSQTTLDPKTTSFVQLTSQSGQEFFPTLSPDGSVVVYTTRDGDDWDLVERRVGDLDTTRNLTSDCDEGDRQPAFSPDGTSIAFRSERDGGGIFVMNSDGTNVRKIIAEGFYPAWSPDGREIVFSTGDFINPAERFTQSVLFAVNLENGQKRGIIVTEDAIQASWSPRGHRIAYWYYGPGGRRDIRTVSSDGTAGVVPVTDDTAIDWNPVWSPDGEYLYFASNRGGSMNLWRIPIDEVTGKTGGPAEPFFTPASYFEHLSIAADGRSFAFAQGNYSSNIERLDFDPATGKVAPELVPITSGAKMLRNPSVSPDGELIAFDSLANRQEDLFVMRRDGSDLRQLTNDPFKDRAPRWAPDGKSLVFYSSRSGKYEGWQINIDGSGLKQLTTTEREQQLTMWSPDGRFLLANQDGFSPRIYPQGENAGEPFELPRLDDEKLWLMAMDWSSDSRQLIGSRYHIENDSSSVVLFDLESQKYVVLAESGLDPFWLPDNRRIVFVDQGRLFLMNTTTRDKRLLFSVQPNEIQLLSIAPDGKSIYLTVQRSEADIWIARAE